jgi:shikimate dehydrogenase
MFAEQTGEAIAYTRLEAPVDDFAGTVGLFFAEGGAGANVTVPFKEDAFFWVTERDQFAGAAGAVNTIIKADGGFRGSNTDGLGLVADLRRHLGALDGMAVLLLGAGGAVRGVVGPLLGAGVGRIVIANRTHARALDLIDRFEDPRVTAQPLDAPLAGFDLIVNGTSAGLKEELPGLDPRWVPGAVAYDMLYGVNKTAFCGWAAGAGAAAVHDGLGMLVEQAAEAFALWRGVRPATDVVLDAMRRDG